MENQSVQIQRNGTNSTAKLCIVKKNVVKHFFLHLSGYFLAASIIKIQSFPSPEFGGENVFTRFYNHVTPLGFLIAGIAIFLQSFQPF
jgi:hypothetical protein